MKKFTLVLARHGKTHSSSIDGSDFKRDLKEKGIEQSHVVGKGIQKMIGEVDLLISSSANRAIQTAKILSKEFGYAKELIQIEDSIYESRKEDALDVIKKIGSDHKVVVMVGHNPTWSELVHVLQPKLTQGLRTSDLAVIKLNIDQWKDIHPMSGELLYTGRFEE